MATMELLPAEIAARLRARGHRWSFARPLVGDVSRRRYLRLDRSGSGSCLLALYPEDLREVCRRFETTSRLLTEAGIRVPEILDSECGAGWMLVEDLGPETLYERYRQEISWEALRPHYLAAWGIGQRFAALPEGQVASLNPPLDRELLLRELDPTWRFFLEPLGLDRQAAGHRLDDSLTALCQTLAAEPLVPCHRDFMVRNLVPLGPGDGCALGVLDHQDVRLGPRFYDLASLLNDSFFPPPALEAEVLEAAEVTCERHLVAYRRAAVQRTLKAVGTYARHDRHPDLIRPTFERALDHLERLPEGEGLGVRLSELRRRAGTVRDLLD